MHEIIVPEKNENAVAELQNIYPRLSERRKKKTKKTFAFYFKYREIVVIFGK
jgi:hypothetical protein